MNKEVLFNCNLTEKFGQVEQIGTKLGNISYFNSKTLPKSFPVKLKKKKVSWKRKEVRLKSAVQNISKCENESQAVIINLLFKLKQF